MEGTQWLDEVLTAQRSFLLGLLCMVCAILMRRSGALKIADTLPVSKLTFNFCFPCMLFAKIWKLEIHASLGRVAAVSVGVHILWVSIVLACSFLVPRAKGFRGQWIYCLSGFNIGFVYPLVLASESLTATVFPALVIWDLAGNVAIVFGFNYLVAMAFAPPPPAGAEEGSPPSAEALAAAAAPPPPSAAAEAAGRQSAMQPAAATADEDVEAGPSEVAAAAAAAAPAAAAGTSAAALAAAAAAADCEESWEPPTPPPKQQLEGAAAAERRGSVVDFARLLQLSGGGGCLGGSSSSKARSAFVAFRRMTTNPPLVAEVLGLLVNLSGLTVPKSIDGLIEAIGEPFSVLFFLLVGVNLVWAKIRPQLGRVFQVASCRLLLAAALAPALVFSGLLPEAPMRRAAVLAMFSPVSGIAMGHTLDFGFDSSFQAALMATTNMVSFAILWALINLA